jgi:hypothetical protein
LNERIGVAAPRERIFVAVDLFGVEQAALAQLADDVAIALDAEPAGEVGP